MLYADLGLLVPEQELVLVLARQVHPLDQDQDLHLEILTHHEEVYKHLFGLARANYLLNPVGMVKTLWYHLHDLLGLLYRVRDRLFRS